MVRVLSTVLVAIIFLTVIVTVSGCGSKQDMLNEMTGTWNSKNKSSPINIYLTGDQKTIVIGDRVIPVKVKTIKQDSYSVLIETKDGEETGAEWSLREVWDDNGIDFNIEFVHGDIIDVLTRADS